MASMQRKAVWALPDPVSQIVPCNGRIHSLTNVNCLTRHPPEPVVRLEDKIGIRIRIWNEQPYLPFSREKRNGDAVWIEG